MPQFHSYTPADGHGLPHDPFKAIVAPRPIGWISSQSEDGRVNLAPYSFFNALCDTPPIVGFSSSGWKDSTQFISETREFVFNLATRRLAEAMNQTSGNYPRGVSEFGEAGLTPLPSDRVAPPRVGEAAAALECKVIDIIRLTNAAGMNSNNYLVLGEVVRVHIDRAFLDDGLFDIVAAGSIARCGYRDYAEVTEVFTMTRPVV